jgi:hypothetical protein
VYAAIFVFVLQKTPAGNKIPSSGKVKLITSPLGTSPMNKVVPLFDVVVSSRTPAPTASEAIIIIAQPVRLRGIIIASVDLVACISLL